MKLNPLSNYVVCKQEEAQTKTASGLYLPENAKEKPRTAKVLGVGKDVKETKVGDVIIYKSYSITDISIDKEDFILLKEEDILATVKETK